METTIKSIRLKGEVMESLFDNSGSDFSIKYYENKDMNKNPELEFQDQHVYTYEIKIRHSDDLKDPIATFKQAALNRMLSLLKDKKAMQEAENRARKQKQLYMNEVRRTDLA